MKFHVVPVNQKILILGGTGFVGPAVVSLLVRSGQDVTLLNRGTRAVPDTRHLQADRNRPQDLKKVLHSADSHYDAIIDLSCYDAEQARLAWEAFSSRTRRWIYLSSAAVYKDDTDTPPKESARVGGTGLWGRYGIDKYAAEQFLLTHAQGDYSPQVIILRAPYIYGPQNNIDRETFVWVRALNAQPVFIPGDGQTPIQFLHVSDLADAIKLFIDTSTLATFPGIYNIAADECPTLREWVSLLAEIAGVKDPGIIAGELANDFLPRQFFPFRDCRCWVDSSLIKTEVNWFPRYSLKEGFLHTYQSYPENSLKHFPINDHIRNIENQLNRKYVMRSACNT